MMINSKKDLKEYLSYEDKLYPLSHKKSYIFTKEPIVYIAKMQKYLRKAEYYKNSKKSIFGSLLYLINRKKKNKYERKINSEIPVNVFAKGLVIYHGGNVDELVDTIEEFLTLNNATRKLMGIEGRKHVVKNFSREIVVNAYKEKIKAILR